MTNDHKRLVACILFGLAAFGAFLPSYIHVAAYFAGAVPLAWLYAAYVGAFALDVLAVACGYALIIMAVNAEGRRWLHVGLWAPVALSVWVNWRYVAAHPVAGAYALDPYVSACLPVLLVIATHGLAAVLRAIPADAPASATTGTRAARLAAFGAPVHLWEDTPADAPPKLATPPRKAPKPAARGNREWLPYAQQALSAGLSQANAARAAGKDQAQISRALASGELVKPGRVASANGASAGAGASGGGQGVG